LVESALCDAPDSFVAIAFDEDVHCRSVCFGDGAVLRSRRTRNGQLGHTCGNTPFVDIVDIDLLNVLEKEQGYIDFLEYELAEEVCYVVGRNNLGANPAGCLSKWTADDRSIKSGLG
jgi:hypothetical protein